MERTTIDDEKLLNDMKNFIKINKEFRFDSTTIKTKDVEGLLDLIHRLQSENERLDRVETELQELNAKYYNEAKDLRRANKELQKQVHELKVRNEKLLCEIYGVKVG